MSTENQLTLPVNPNPPAPVSGEGAGQKFSDKGAAPAAIHVRQKSRYPLEELKSNRELRESLAGKRVRIWQGDHGGAWWRPPANGYTTSENKAAVYPFDLAWLYSSHCGPEKQISFDVLSDPPIPRVRIEREPLEEKDTNPESVDSPPQKEDGARLEFLHSVLIGRYPFITTIESGLDAAAWEREELREALQTLRDAISDFNGHGMPGFRDRAVAYLALNKADAAITSSRFALERHLSEHGSSSNASGSTKEWTFAEWAGSEGWDRDECPESWAQGEEIWEAARNASGNPNSSSASPSESAGR